MKRAEELKRAEARWKDFIKATIKATGAELEEGMIDLLLYNPEAQEALLAERPSYTRMKLTYLINLQLGNNK